MILYCEDCRCSVEAIPSLADRETLEGLTIEDEAHMEHELSNPNWVDTDLRDFDYA